MESSVDVVIVGAGLAGLVAARYLHQKAPHLKVVVLEAKTRVGGRTETVNLRTADGGLDNWDTGAQWVGPTQHYTLRLLEELGLEIYEQYSQGTRLGQIGSTEIRPFDTFTPTNSSVVNPKDTLGQINRLISKFESMKKKVAVTDPFHHPEAVVWDSLSIEAFARQTLETRLEMDYAELIARTTYGCGASRVSLLYLLACCHSAGSLEDILSAVDNGAQRYKIKGGAQQIADKLVEEIGEDKIRLGWMVWKIHQEQSGCLLRILDIGKREPTTEKIRCKRVILAIPPAQASQIEFYPTLPAVKHQMINAYPPGSFVKFIVTYARAFWRDKGYSGEIMATGMTEKPGEVMPLSFCNDGTNENGQAAIVGFFNSEWASQPIAVRRDAVLKDLARFIGDEALDFVDYIDKDWSQEPYTGGCPMGVLLPGYMEALTHIREPTGKIHWAGTATATKWIGYMDGAIQSGIRAGAEVMHELVPNARIREEELEGSVYAKNYKKPTLKNHSYPSTRSVL